MSERHLAPGQVLLRKPFTLGECIGCGLDAEGHTLTTWCWDGPGKTYPMCFWCLELWDARGWLAANPVDVSTPDPDPTVPKPPESD